MNRISAILFTLGTLLSLSSCSSYSMASAFSSSVKSKIVNPGATYETQRVFLSNENTYFYENDEYGVPCKNGVKYEISGSSFIIEMPYVVNSNSLKLYYADIPYKVRSISFVRLSGSEEHDTKIYQEAKVEALSYGVCYYTGTSSLEDYSNVVMAPVYGSSAIVLARVVESYLTYGKDDSNGTTNFTVKNLFNTWFKNKAASKDDLKDMMIWDYTGYAANGNKYDGLVKNAQFSVNEKWNTMCSQAGVDPNTGLDRNNFLEWIKEHKLLVIGGGVAIILVATLTVIIVISKKKKQSEN